MSSGTFYEGQLTGGGPLYANPMRVAAGVEGYELRTSEQRIATLEQRLAILEQRLAEQGMLIAQLREVVQGEPPFLALEGDWHMGE